MPQITAARVVEADGYVTSQPLDAFEPEHLRYALELAGAGCTTIIANTPHNTGGVRHRQKSGCSCRGRTSILSPPCSGRSGALSRDDWPISTGPPSLVKSFVVGALDGSREPRKARCMLTRVRLGEDAKIRSLAQGPRWPARSRRGSNARLTVEMKPFRARMLAITTAISSRCQRDVGRGRRRRSSRANNGPNFKTHRRTVS
jgi:hypothetical protein